MSCDMTSDLTCRQFNRRLQNYSGDTITRTDRPIWRTKSAIGPNRVSLRCGGTGRRPPRGWKKFSNLHKVNPVLDQLVRQYSILIAAYHLLAWRPQNILQPSSTRPIRSRDLRGGCRPDDTDQLRVASPSPVDASKEEPAALATASEGFNSGSVCTLGIRPLSERQDDLHETPCVT